MGVWVLETNGHTTYHHTGFWGTMAVHVPELDLTLAVTANQNQAKPVFDRILTELAEATGGRALFTSRAGRLSKAFGQIANDLRNQYSIAYVSGNPTRDGKWRKIDVLTPGRELEERRVDGREVGVVATPKCRSLAQAAAVN